MDHTDLRTAWVQARQACVDARAALRVADATIKRKGKPRAAFLKAIDAREVARQTCCNTLTAAQAALEAYSRTPEAAVDRAAYLEAKEAWQQARTAMETAREALVAAHDTRAPHDVEETAREAWVAAMEARNTASDTLNTAHKLVALD